jgi:hypothetical protein
VQRLLKRAASARLASKLSCARFSPIARIIARQRQTYDLRMTAHPSPVVAACQLQDSVSFRAGIGTSIAL